MKKTNFLKGLAAVVLGCMFTSCEKEDLNATFQPNGATAQIDVTVIDVATAATKNATLTADALNGLQPSITGSSVRYEAAKGNGITGGTVAINADVNGDGAADGNATATVATLKAGEDAVYDKTIYISSVLDFTCEVVDLEDVTEWASNLDHVGNVSHSYTHDGMTHNNWFKNTTDYYQPYTITVTWNPIKEVTKNIATGLDESIKSQIEREVERLEGQLAETRDYAYNAIASAWSYFNAYATFDLKKENWTVTSKTTGEQYATFTVTKVAGVTFKHVEYAALGHEGHYVHGHGHGNGSNAGGGISIAE